MTVSSKVSFTTTAIAGSLVITDATPTTPNVFNFDVNASAENASAPVANTTTEGWFATNKDNSAALAAKYASGTLNLDTVAFISDGNSTTAAQTFTFAFRKTSDNAGLMALKLTAGSAEIGDQYEYVIASNDSTYTVGKQIAETASGDILLRGAAAEGGNAATGAYASTGIITAKFTGGTQNTDRTTAGYTVDLDTGAASSAVTVTITFTYYGDTLKSITAQDISIALKLGDTSCNDIFGAPQSQG